MDIIILIFLCVQLSGLFAKKGLPVTKWIIRFILRWILGEFIGIFFGVLIFGMDNIVSIGLMGLAGAFGAYFITRHYLDRLPDISDNDHFGG